MEDQQTTKPAPRFHPVLVSIFLLIIGLLAWSATLLVAQAPAGVARLADIVESVNNSQQSILDFTEDTVDIDLAANTTFTKTSETVTLSWADAAAAGTFFFSHNCVAGVAVDLFAEGALQSIECDTLYNLGVATEADIVINSEKDQYTDVTYTITFIADGDAVAAARGNGTITVVNEDISNFFADNNQSETTFPTLPDSELTTPPETTPDPTPSTEPTPTVAGTATANSPTTPVYAPVYITPVSDPNGRTDLATSFVSTGNIIGDTFFAQAIVKDHRGAVQFSVTNLGTKTSQDWTYTITLPSGRNYTSPTQTPLKPNERALITVGFPTPDVSTHTFTVNIDESTDRTSLNDQFTRTVAFVK